MKGEETVQYEEQGRIVKGLGGLYDIQLDRGTSPLSGQRVACRAKGQLRHLGVSPLVGDRVVLSFDDSSLLPCENGGFAPHPDGRGMVISRITERKNALIRPPMANLDLLFITVAAAAPAPVFETVDKLISIAEFNKIEPVIVIGKCELDRDTAEALRATYVAAGFTVFVLSALTGEGVAPLRDWIAQNLAGRIAAFSGASGVGKSTLLNALYQGLGLETAAISRKIERGKHTTRHVELFEAAGGYVADTPGFGMLDFVHFDFFTAADLPLTMREFLPLVGTCRYTKCSHTKEEGCAVLAAVREGRIAPSRHVSFVAMHEALKNKREWSKKT